MRKNVFLEKVKQNKGVTLTEILIVVAIMSVLLAVSMFSIGNAKETMEMTEVDDYAKSIYLEVQNQLSAIEVAGGMPKLYNELETNYSGRFLAAAPKDYVGADETWGDDVEEKICYITREEAISVGLMPNDSYSSSKMNGDYIIELNAQTGDVYGVFYWNPEGEELENEITYSDIQSLATRNRDDRTEDRLGYYGGTSMTTVALLENASEEESVYGPGGWGGKMGGMVYYELYEDGTYGVLVLADDKKKTNCGHGDYYEKLERMIYGNTLRDASGVRNEIVECGFAAFTGEPEGYWRYYDYDYWGARPNNKINEFGQWISGIQQWPLIANWGEPMPNIMPDEEMQDQYYLKLVKKEENGAFEEPTATKDHTWGTLEGYDGQIKCYISGSIGFIPPIDEYGQPTNGHLGNHVQYDELFDVLNMFLTLRYDKME